MANNRYKLDDPANIYVKNKSTPPWTEQHYYTEVNKKTGEVHLFKDVSPTKNKTLVVKIGSYDKGMKNFTPDDENATPKEKKWFAKGGGGKKHIKKIAIDTTKAGIQDASPNLSASEIDDQAKGLINNGTPVPPPDSNAGSTAGYHQNSSLKFADKLVYPLDLGEDPPQDRLNLFMYKYNPSGFKGSHSATASGGSGGLASGDRQWQNESDAIARIFLPIPGGISDVNQVDWGSDSMNAAQIALSSLAINTIKSGIDGARKTAGGLVESADTNNEAIKTAIGGYFASKASGSNMASFLGRTEGAVINPNMELLFKGPMLRSFDFKWILTPRSENEGKQILEIIRTFKQGMAALRGESVLFLKTPPIWQLEYKQNGDTSPHLNKFKQCALINCKVGYTPNGSYMTYESGIMVAYELSLSFKELTPVYNDDYGEDTKNSIGY